MKVLYPLAAASVAAFFLSLTALAWLYGPRLLLHADGVLTRAEGVESKINASAINLDKATAAWSKSAQSQADAVTDLVTDAHGTLSQANTALQGISGVAQHVSGTADAATGLLASARATTDTLPPLIGDIRTQVQGIGPAEASIASAGAHLDELLKRKAIEQILDNVAGMTSNANGILVDGRKVSDKLTNDFVAPKPWWKKIGPSLSDVWDFSALAARHTP